MEVEAFYLKVHEELCKLLNINIKPTKIEITDRYKFSWCNKEKGIIFIPTEYVKTFDEIKLAGILAHEDIHYILSNLNVNIDKTLEEAIATVAEYLIMFKHSENKEKIRKEIEGRLRYNLDDIEDEKKGIPRIGYIIGLTLISKLKEEDLIKILKVMIDSKKQKWIQLS